MTNMIGIIGMFIVLMLAILLSSIFSNSVNQTGGYMCDRFSENSCLAINPNWIQRTWEFPLRQAYDTARQAIPDYFKRPSGHLCRQDYQCTSGKCSGIVPVCN